MKRVWAKLTGEQRLEAITAAWNEGRSASEIAREFEGCSRNAVIGYAHRNGLTRFDRATSSGLGSVNRAAQATRPRPVSAKVEPRTQAKAFGETKVKPALVFANPGSEFSTEPKAPFEGVKRDAFAPLPGSKPIPWTERKFGQCAWPVDGGDVEQLSCAAACGEETYCLTHLRLRAPKTRPGAGRPQTATELARSLRRYVA